MKEQTFGVELETTGLGREKTAKVIADYFGTTAYYEGLHHSNWVVKMPDGRVWNIENDSSVTNPAAEVVTPVCTWEDIETIQEIIRALRNAGAKADASCGVHVHVGMDGHDAQTLRNLVNIVNAKEDLLTEALKITPYRRDHYCEPVDQRFLERLNRRKPKDLDTFKALWYGTDDWRWHTDPSNHYDSTRYHLLNLHSAFQGHSLEFRAFNGTMHAGEVKAYIQLCLAISAKAKASKSASPARPQTDNPAYTFRCWLLQLGLIGEEFKTARQHLLKNLPGNAAWRNGNPTARRDN